MCQWLRWDGELFDPIYGWLIAIIAFIGSVKFWRKRWLPENEQDKKENLLEAQFLPFELSILDKKYFGIIILAIATLFTAKVSATAVNHISFAMRYKRISVSLEQIKVGDEYIALPAPQPIELIVPRGTLEEWFFAQPKATASEAEPAAPTAPAPEAPAPAPENSPSNSP